MRRPVVLATLVALLTTLFGTTAALAVDPAPRSPAPAPQSVEELRLDEPVSTTGFGRPSTMDASLFSATGVRQVVVRLTADPVAELASRGATASAQRVQFSEVQAQQDAFLASTAAGAEVLARVEIALNAVALSVDASRLPAIAADPQVESVNPVIDYEYDLAETVPYIGAEALHDAPPGLSGAGISVAVLDSGIDYTHTAFGGDGTLAAYTAAYGTSTDDPRNTTLDGLFPTDRVVGGYDFVGESWPDGDLAPDPDPIDCGTPTIDCMGGHGTHVADIIGGVDGVAPAADLYAVKVCSAISTSCSGIALLQGIDFALDPNGDGLIDDAVDLINMSLGSDYGQAKDDDLALATQNATLNGVLTVAAAGNGGDKPYVTGTPAAASTALSVAQTNVPSARLPLLEVVTPASIAGFYPAVFQPWSAELTDAIAAPLVHDDSTNGRRLGCRLAGDDPLAPDLAQPNPFAAGSLNGLVVLVDRGACTFSEKIANIALAGGVAGIIGLVTPEDPFQGGFGDCPENACETIPGFMIGQDLNEDLQAALEAGAVNVRLDPADGLPLIGTMVGSSSRGPTMLTNEIKPEIGAPGASVSAIAGSGADTGPFGGTSGAAPMVTGSAALLLQELPARTPNEIKALLMNYAETEIYNGAPQAPISSPLAAIQRIGAGEVRVDDSHAGRAVAAWATDGASAALSFGFHDITDATTVLTRSVTVRNYSGVDKTFDLSTEFRFTDDATNGAVTPSLSAPTLTVPAGQEASFDVTLTIDGTALREWALDSGFNGANGEAATLLEYDGYVWLDGTAETLHLPWHVLPRLSGDVSASTGSFTLDEEFEGLPADTVGLMNDGVGTATISTYSLLGTSPDVPEGPTGGNAPVIDLRYAGVQTYGSAGCDSGFILAFAVNTWERQTHANAPASIEWDLDTNGDGEYEYAVFSFDAALTLGDGRNLTFALDLETGDLSAFFFTAHATNSGNTVLFVCGEQIGLAADDLGTAELTADVLAVDFYFTGTVTDVIEGLQFGPLREHYLGIVGDDGFGGGELAPGAEADLHIVSFGPAGTNPAELGVLLLNDGLNGAPPHAEAIAIVSTNEPPVLAAIADRSLDEGDTVNVGLSATDPDGDALSLGATLAGGDPLPDWMTLTDDGDGTGNLELAPLSSDSGSYDVTVSASDGDLADSETFTVTVTDPDAPFIDIDGHPFEQDIIWVYNEGITAGCSADPPRYCPENVVNREQMASFLVRALDLPATDEDYFTDDNASIHEGDINALVEAGITSGCGGTNFCPRQPVLREQMASFLARALQLTPSSADHFTDDDDSIHEGNIDALFEAGVTSGCGGTRFCPTVAVTRGQMAAFLHRAFGP